MPARFTRQCIALLALAGPLTIASPQAYADDSGIVWNGFMNIVGGALLHDAVMDFSSPHQAPNYQGYEHHLTFDPQTSAALQAQKKLDDQFSVTMQLYGEGDIDNYAARLKWLYVTYEPSYHSRFRIGKISAPVYFYSDYLNVGYAYHWISPPESVYPFDTGMNGVNYVYQNTWGNFDWSGELMVGSGDDYFPIIGSRVMIRNSHGAAFNISTGDWLSFRAMMLKTTATFDVDVLQPDSLNAIVDFVTRDALASEGVPSNQIDALAPSYIDATMQQLDNGALNLKKFPITYGDLAVRMENTRWLLMAEIITVQTDTYLYNDAISKFVTGGVHVGKALFHMTVAQGRANGAHEIANDLANNTPANLSPDAVGDVIASQIRARLAGAFSRSQESISLGVRYETSSNSALKFEATRLREIPTFEGDTVGVGYNTLLRAALNLTF